MAAPLKICFAASEVAPLAKTGGLADVSGALPRVLHRQGHDVRLFLPYYDTIGELPGSYPVEYARSVEVWLGPRSYTFSLITTQLPGSDLWIYLVDCPELFRRGSIYTSDGDEGQRFALFSRAVIESCQRMGFAPQVLHCNDWHTGLIPLLLRSVYQWDALFHGTRTLMTIHNIGYQGVFPADSVSALGLDGWGHLLDQADLRAGRINFLRTGLLYADVVTTVSPTYAREIQSDEMSMGLGELLRARSGTLIGILNGVDYDTWSPDLDPHIPQRYSAATLDDKGRNKRHLQEQLGLSREPGRPLLGMVTRLTRQKGIDLAVEVLPEAIAGTDLDVAVLGSGEARYERAFEVLQRAHPGRVVFYRGYSEPLAHLVEAGADMFLMPSLYEPCGLNQMFSLRYGTIPIVRRTGGLADSVRQFDEGSGDGTGFLFDHFDAAGLRWALAAALRAWRRPDAWRRLMLNAMAENFSWDLQSAKYVDIYRWLAERAG